MHLTTAVLPGGLIDKALAIRVRRIAISEESGGKVATLTGFIRQDFGYSPSLREFVVNPSPPLVLLGIGLDVVIVADERAQTIVLTLDIYADNGGPRTYTFSGVDLRGFPLTVVDISQ